MEYKNEEYKTSFTVPDRVTVRAQMAYYSESARAGGDELFMRLWFGARTLIQNWQSELLPDLHTDLETVTDPTVTAVLMWAAMRVQEHINKLETLPKN